VVARDDVEIRATLKWKRSRKGLMAARASDSTTGSFMLAWRLRQPRLIG